MGSVMDYEVCQHCGGVKFVDYYYKTGEEYTFCQRCGTVDNWVMKRNEEGKVILHEEGGPVAEHIFEAGYGTYAIMYKEGVGQTGTFSKPISDEAIAEFKEIFSKPDIDVEKSFLARWENGEQTLLLGTEIPEMNRLGFEDWIKSAIAQAEHLKSPEEKTAELLSIEIELSEADLPTFDEIVIEEK